MRGSIKAWSSRACCAGLGLALPCLLATGAFAEDVPSALGPSDPLILIGAACPRADVTLANLDAVRRVNYNAAIAIAMREAERVERSRGDRLEADELRYRVPSDPAEVAETLREEYGPDSILFRTADAVAAIAEVAEHGSQAPFDRVNRVTDKLVNGRRGLSRWRALSDLKLRSRVSTRKAGVSMYTRW